MVNNGMGRQRSAAYHLATALLLSVAFFCVFTAFSAIQNLEASVVSGHCPSCAMDGAGKETAGICRIEAAYAAAHNLTDGVCADKPSTDCGLKCPEGYEECPSSDLGSNAIATLYLVFTVSCIWGPAVVNYAGPKWAIVLGFCAFTLFCGANVAVARRPADSEFDTAVLVSAAALVGFAASFLWTAQGSYLTAVAGGYARRKALQPAQALGLFNGIFFGIFQITQISGNLAASLLLDQAKWSMASLFTFYLGCAVLGVILAAFLPHPEKERSDGGALRVVERPPTALQSMRAMVGLWRDRRMVLLIPLIMYSGLEQGFMWGDFTSNYVKPSVGTNNIGYVMVAFGAADVLGSVVLGKLSDVLGRTAIIAFGAACQAGVGGYLLYFVEGGPGMGECEGRWTLLVTAAAVWGLGDAVWNTQCNALIGSVFTQESVGAFSNYKLWQSLSVSAAFFYSARLPIAPKLVIMLSLLVVGLVGYTLLLCFPKSRPKAVSAEERKLLYSTEEDGTRTNINVDGGR